MGEGKWRNRGGLKALCSVGVSPFFLCVVLCRGLGCLWCSGDIMATTENPSPSKKVKTVRTLFMHIENRFA